MTVIWLPVKRKEITVIPLIGKGWSHMAKVGRGADQFPLRLPDGMRDWIKETAKVAGRSMNDEIVLRLERSLLLDDMGARPMQVRRHQNTASDEAIEHLRRALELLTSKEV